MYVYRDPARPEGDRGRPTALIESAVREHLERLLHSPQFDASGRSRAFLAYICDETLGGHGESLNQAVIARAVFRRGADFDAALDPIVRVQAGRLRRSLERYYLLTGESDTVRIELPKGGYAPVFATADLGAAGSVSAVKSAVVDWPTVVIRPFGISSPLDDERASRVQDELTMELCRHGDVRVVRQSDMDRLGLKRQASVRFELQVNLRSSRESCLIGTRLVDRATGEQLWSDEYHTTPKPGRWSSSIDDAARIIAARIGSEHGVIVRQLAREHCAQHVGTPDAFSVILSCHGLFHSRLVGELIPIVEALQRLTAREPEIPVAWSYLARLYLINHSFELSGLPTPVEKAIDYACQGVRLDPAGARGRCILVEALLVKGEVQSAREEVEQALRINPDSLAYREVIGCLMALAGDWERGMALMRDAMERNPYCMPHGKYGLWADSLRRGDFERAHSAALEYWDSSYFWRELMIACSLGHLGRPGEAQATAAALLQAKPKFRDRGRALIGYYIKSTELRELINDGLRKAGLALA